MLASRPCNLLKAVFSGPSDHSLQRQFCPSIILKRRIWNTLRASFGAKFGKLRCSQRGADAVICLFSDAAPLLQKRIDSHLFNASIQKLLLNALKFSAPLVAVLASELVAATLKLFDVQSAQAVDIGAFIVTRPSDHAPAAHVAEMHRVCRLKWRDARDRQNQFFVVVATR